jgi:hypothetical protein
MANSIQQQKNAIPSNEAAPNELQPRSEPADNSESSSAQRRRVLDALRSGPKSTIQLRRDWDILSPAARVLELKRRGSDILTQWVHHATDCGKLHRVALYVLLRETGGHAWHGPGG